MGYKISSLLRRGINGLISFLLLLLLLLAAAYAIFALWDNKRIYSAAENVQQDMLKLKPQDSPDAEQPSFEELLEINPDVKGWLSMENTKIDFPILQGENNLSYINTDVYGNFALAGSIFMDSRNKPDFSDRYNLLYGHHMEGGNMFGDLDKYRDSDFFFNNPNGQLLLPQGKYNLSAFAVLLVKASDYTCFSPYAWGNSPRSALQYISENALLQRQELIDGMMGGEFKVLALTTCATDFTDARLVLLTLMTPKE